MPRIDNASLESRKYKKFFPIRLSEVVILPSGTQFFQSSQMILNALKRRKNNFVCRRDPLSGMTEKTTTLKKGWGIYGRPARGFPAVLLTDLYSFNVKRSTKYELCNKLYLFIILCLTGKVRHFISYTS